MLCTFTVCQTPGDAEITKTNATCKTKSFHTFEEVTFHKWAYTGALRKADCMTLNDEVCVADTVNSLHHQDSCPPLAGGYRHCFQNPSASSPQTIGELC